MSKEGDSRVPRGLGSLDTHFGVLGVTTFKQKQPLRFDFQNRGRDFFLAPHACGCFQPSVLWLVRQSVVHYPHLVSRLPNYNNVFLQG